MMTWFWILIALVTLGIEIITVGTLVSIWFSVGALAAYVVAMTNVAFEIQLLVFSAVSILTFLTVRPIAAKYFSKRQEATNADRYIGQRFTVTETVTPEKWGAVKIQGVRWSVREVNGETVDIGQLVEIIALEGAKLLVKKVQ